MQGHLIDVLRTKLHPLSKEAVSSWPLDTKLIETDYGNIRVRDTEGTKPAIVIVPDGPCVIEHYHELIRSLASDFRVVCFEMPGIGFSYPRFAYDFGLEKSARLIISILDILNIDQTILSFSCSNGFFALATAQKFPERVTRLILAQTPSLASMKIWGDRIIPKPLRIPFIGQIVMALNAKKLASMWYDTALPRDSSEKDSYREKAITAIQSGGCFCLASIVQALDTNSQKLSDITVPTTLVWGNKDFSHKDTKFESIRDHVPHCEIIQFDGCGHFPDLERPKEYTALLRKSV